MEAGASRRFGLRRADRMRRREEFQRTMREGRVLRRAAFTLYALAVPGAGRRLGIVCGRRVGTAVARNRVRRRLREIVRQAPELFRDGWWLVVVAQPAGAGADFGALARELRAALARLTAADENPRPTT